MRWRCLANESKHQSRWPTTKRDPDFTILDIKRTFRLLRDQVYDRAKWHNPDSIVWDNLSKSAGIFLITRSIMLGLLWEFWLETTIYLATASLEWLIPILMNQTTLTRTSNLKNILYSPDQSILSYACLKSMNIWCSTTSPRKPGWVLILFAEFFSCIRPLYFTWTPSDSFLSF